MRLWSLHPKYLDAKGLVALWRETLLAQNVLIGKTKGYKNHPQLNRFKATDNPTGAIASYLCAIADEADHRQYRFQRIKIIDQRYEQRIPVTTGQLEYENQHLLKKLAIRDQSRYLNLQQCQSLETHSLFKVIEGDVEDWEIIT